MTSNACRFWLCTTPEGAECSCSEGARGSTIAESFMLEGHPPKKLLGIYYCQNGTPGKFRDQGGNKSAPQSPTEWDCKEKL